MFFNNYSKRFSIKIYKNNFKPIQSIIKFSLFISGYSIKYMALKYKVPFYIYKNSFGRKMYTKSQYETKHQHWCEMLSKLNSY